MSRLSFENIPVFSAVKSKQSLLSYLHVRNNYRWGTFSHVSDVWLKFTLGFIHITVMKKKCILKWLLKNWFSVVSLWLQYAKCTEAKTQQMSRCKILYEVWAHLFCCTVLFLYLFPPSPNNLTDYYHCSKQRYALSSV